MQKSRSRSSSSAAAKKPAKPEKTFPPWKPKPRAVLMAMNDVERKAYKLGYLRESQRRKKLIMSRPWVRPGIIPEGDFRPKKLPAGQIWPSEQHPFPPAAVEGIPGEVHRAMRKLYDFVHANKHTLEWNMEPLRDIEYRVHILDEKLPPSFRRFLLAYGKFWVRYVASDLVRLWPPQIPSITDLTTPPPSDTIPFQWIIDDLDGDTYDFNTLVDLGDGEHPVVEHWHHRPLKLRKRPHADDRTFNQHIVAVVEDFVVRFAFVSA